MLIDVYNKAGEATGQIELADSVFGIEPNDHAMHQAVVAYLANQRQGTKKTKIRSATANMLMTKRIFFVFEFKAVLYPPTRKRG